MNLLLIDEHPLASFGLAQLLHTQHSGLQVQYAQDQQQALATLESAAPPNWLLLAVNSRALLNTPFFCELLRSPWAGKTLLITVEACHAHLQDALDAGVRAIIPKTASAPEVLDAFAAVLRGQTSVPARLAPPLRPRASDNVSRKPLSPRLRDVLACLLRGTPNKLIARQLGISDYTVKEYVSALLAHHQVANRIELLLKLQGAAL